MRKLERSNQSVIGGVCGGIANYFEIDPVIVRVIATILLFGSGIGILPYIILWCITPLGND